MCLCLQVSSVLLEDTGSEGVNLVYREAGK